MSQKNVDELMELWTLTMIKHNDFGPFENHAAMNKVIDQIEQGSAPWKCLVTQIDPNLPPHAPSWQRDQYQIWYRDPDTVISHILANPDFCSEFDVSPYVHVGPDGQRRWCDFMSGNYAWKQAVCLIYYWSIGRLKLMVSVFRHEFTLTILQLRVRCMLGLFSAAIRQQFLSQRGMWSIIPSTSLSVTSSTLLDVAIEMP